jgi:hypothetical protein
MQLGADRLQVQLCGESVGILDQIEKAAEWWPEMDEDQDAGAQDQAVAGLFVSARRKRKRASGRANHMKDAKEKEAKHGKEGKHKVNKKKDKKEKKEKKEKEKKENEKPKCWLKKARKEKPVAFEEKHFRRNGVGPVLVAQTMVKMKCLEEAKFHEEASCFNVDGKCMIENKICSDIMWEDVVNKAHDFLCAEWLAIQRGSFFLFVWEGFSDIC